MVVVTVVDTVAVCTEARVVSLFEQSEHRQPWGLTEAGALVVATPLMVVVEGVIERHEQPMETLLDPNTARYGGKVPARFSFGSGVVSGRPSAEVVVVVL